MEDGKERETYRGEELRAHDEAEADRILHVGLRVLKLKEQDLLRMAKGATEKQVLAWWLRKRRVVSRKWISQRLNMGDVSRVTQAMSVVNAIAQDRQGFLWFATQDGLNRYDGYKFRIFKHDPEKPDSLGANWIQSLLVDSSGNLWIGTFGGGLNRYDSQTGQFIRFLPMPDPS